MIDYQTALYDPVYLALGVPATITLNDSGATGVAITVIDKTAGIDIGGDVNVASIKPAAVARFAEIVTAGLSRTELSGASILLNGAAWRIEATAPRPSPTGEETGELFLILARADDGSS